MTTVEQDFRQRVLEVRRYFKFTIAASIDEICIRKNESEDLYFSSRESEELLKTLKASAYLILYNLVESTMRGIVTAIFDEFRAQNVQYDDCRDEIKRLVLRNFSRRNNDSLFDKLRNIAADVVTETFESKEIFSGNLDAKAIRKTAQDFGFSPPSEKTGWALYNIKKNRNDLAHGNKSFSEVGKESGPDSLIQARKQTVVILFLTIRNVKKYLSGKHYLAENISVV